MKPEEFVRSIYLGDRACKAILIEGWKRRVSIQVDVLSRLKPGTTAWDFYTGGDINDGWIVFSDVQQMCFDPSGPIPNDLFNELTVTPVHAGKESIYLFQMWIGSVNDTGKTEEVHLRIEARRIHLEDPARPGIEITA